jgi:esterase/lipase superfamily enzyme
MTDRWHVELDAAGFDRPGSVIRYGHWGRPVVVFPSEAGRAWDYENNGMLDAVRPLVDAGRVKLYCVDAFDENTWSDRWLSLEDRARRHYAYEGWITGPVAAFIGQDSPGATEAITTGCSMGAFHAVNFALRRADLFPVAIGLSGSYDPSLWHAGGEPGSAAYELNPSWYVPDLEGDHLQWLRSRLTLVLNVGQGAWETHPTQALPSTRHLAGALHGKGIHAELHEWGPDVSHDWVWWQRQIAYHLPRFC